MRAISITSSRAIRRFATVSPWASKHYHGMALQRLVAKKNGLAGHQLQRSSVGSAIFPTSWKGGRTTLWAREAFISMRITKILCSAFMALISQNILGGLFRRDAFA